MAHSCSRPRRASPARWARGKPWLATSWRARWWLSALTRAGFATQFVVADVAWRRAFDPWGALASVGLWAALGASARGPGARLIVSALAATVLAVNVHYVPFFRATLDEQAVIAALHAWTDVRPVVWQVLPALVVTLVVLAPIEYAALAGGRARPAHVADRASPGVACAALAWAMVAAACRPTTPDLRMVTALGAALTRTARAAASLPLVAAGRPAAAVPSRSAAETSSAPVTAAPSSAVAGWLAESTGGRVLPRVLFVLTESVGVDAWNDATAPALRAALPRRIELPEARSVASYTAIAVSAILTGRTQLGSRAAVLEAPSILDLLRAVRRGGERLRSTYASAHLASVFEGRDVRPALDRMVTLETLVGRAIADEGEVLDLGIDRLLSERVLGEGDAAEGPSFTWLHFAATHAPYTVDPADAPFHPYAHEISWRNLPALRNAYLNAIHAQDAHIAACVRAFVQGAERDARPWVILFTSDHGEAFGEHRAIHHGQNVYDEQLRVPAFVAFSEGALLPSQVTALRAHAGRAVTHLDLAPTLLDLYGVLDAPALQSAVDRFAGQSWLRTPRPRQPLPLTNCTEMFPCPLDTWGVLGDGAKVSAQPWDAGWRCTRISSAAETETASDDPACAPLLAAARGLFPRLPNGHPLP